MMPSAEGVLRLGLLGGTFDPIHEGHLALAKYARLRLKLDRVWFIPSATPPHKHASAITAAPIRMAMTAAAVEPYSPHFAATDLELAMAGPSYTARTLEFVRGHVHPETELSWIVGLDNVTEILKWYSPRRIAELAWIVAGGRPGVREPGDIPEWLRSRLTIMDGPDVPFSSTEVREQLARGVIDGDAIPDPVARIIVQERLYGYDGEGWHVDE